MLYHLLYPLHEFISGLNIIRYITFRAAGAAVMALLVSFIVGPLIIKKLKKGQFKEEIRDDGPASHRKKAGTPTMGGLIILCATIIPTLLFARLDNLYIWLIVFGMLYMGVVGFIDDYIKVRKKDKKGLIARYKFAGQIFLGLVLGTIILTFADHLGANFAENATTTTMPFFKNLLLDYGVFYIPMVILVITATSNGVNLTDGLDGLAIGVVAIASIAVALMCYMSGHIKFADYLNIIYLQGSGELAIFTAALVGASLGFLWFNTNPAQVFMGDVGSLSIGGALGILFILVKKELLLIIIGGIFVAEAASVLIQRYYFKYTKKRYGEGRRVFKMAPLHHHFEMMGWPESKVVVRFWIIEIILVLISLTTFKIR
ncbi:MAG: phospho-N-acetylmuramoyl-pentapeptide-transferase [candidate division Zixibacteria bacterium]|nr:phospho-N-acetylmuramoyl-pentapeptide-transferase [Candidatus Tariuqbacter arcticus]